MHPSEINKEEPKKPAAKPVKKVKPYEVKKTKTTKKKYDDMYNAYKADDKQTS